jgi:hypothetical protein
MKKEAMAAAPAQREAGALAAAALAAGRAAAGLLPSPMPQHRE